MATSFLITAQYKNWLKDLKQQIKVAQIKSAIKLNKDLLLLYWQIGTSIIEKQKALGWGNAVVPKLSTDLQKAFPTMQGFSERNLFYMQRWVEFYTNDLKVIENNSTKKIKKSIKLQQPVAELKKGTKLQQPVAELKKNIKLQEAVAELRDKIIEVPWGHQILLITKVKNTEEALWYIEQTIEHGWSRDILYHQLEWDLYKRQKKTKKVTNFAKTLPPIQSDLAEKVLKDPYVFDFLTLSKDAHERAIENELVKHLTHFLVELGKGFAYVGNQYHLEVGDDDFYLDLLFYHLTLRCYIVIELKAGKFEPGDAGQILFYVNAVDAKLKTKQDKPTIGLILCKEKNKVVAEYALANVDRPIGVSEYQFTEIIPDKIKTELPSIDEIEEELTNYLQAAKKNKKKN